MSRPYEYRSLRQALSATFLALLLVVISIQARTEEPKVASSASAEAQAAAAPAEKTATVFGQKIRYQDAGTGPVVILLHGLGGDASNWATTIGPLSQKYRVIVPDQIGFGKSDKPLINYRVGTLVDFLDGLMKELKIERASLVGNSLGGWTAAEFALAHPQKVDRLILVDAAGYKINEQTDGSIAEGLNPSTRAAIKKIMPLVFYNAQMFGTDAAVDQFYARKISAGDGYTIARFIDAYGRGEDLLDGRVSGIKHRTLIVWGRQDGLTPLAWGVRFKMEIAGSELVIFDKCGHVPQLEKASEFNAAVMKFLEGSK